MARNNVVNWTNQAVYLGETDYKGQASEGSVEVVREMVEMGGLGMPAKVKVPSGRIESMTAKIKFENTSPALLQAAVDNGGFAEFKLIGDAKLLSVDQGFSDKNTVTTRLKGFPENLPLQPHKNEKADFELTVNLVYLEVSSDSEGTILKIDVVNDVVEPAALFGRAESA